MFAENNVCSHMCLLILHCFYTQPSQNRINCKCQIFWKSSYLLTLPRMTFSYIVSNTKKTVAGSSEIFNIMLLKPIIRNLDLYYVCCYIYICTVLNVSIIIPCVKDLLQMKFDIFLVFEGGYLSIRSNKEYSREVTVYEGQSRSSEANCT